MLLVSEDDSAMEVNSNAREYEPRPALATGGGLLARLNVATSCSARKDDARRVALILLWWGRRHDGERIKMMFVLEFAPSYDMSSHPPKSAALLSTYILCTKL